MYANVVLGVDHGVFEDILDNHKNLNGFSLDTDLGAEDWLEIIDAYKEAVERETGKPFPQETPEQLWGAIGAVFGSWQNTRANTYRRLHGIPDSWGTAVNVQAMVFGNLGEVLGHRRRLHAQPLDRHARDLRRVPHQCPGRGRGGRHPHAAAADRGRAQGGGREAALARGGDARHLPPARQSVRHAREALPRHAGHRVHHPGGQALDAADAVRQAHHQGRPQDRRRSRRRRADHAPGGRAAHRRRRARPAAAPDHRSRRRSGTRSRPACRPRRARPRARSCSTPTRPRR